MKNKILTLSLLFSSLLAGAQIYVGGSGAVSIGSTTAAVTTIQSFAPTMFCNTVTGITSAPYIRPNSVFSSASTPDFTFYDNDQCGIYHPSANNISFTTGNNQILNLATNQIDAYSTGAYSQAVISHLTSIYAITWDLKYYNGSTTTDEFYVYGSGDVWTYAYHTLSDARLKENIKTIPNALDKVLKLRGVNYTLIADKYKSPSDTNTAAPKIQMGVIAQEAEKIVPEVVSTGKNGLKGVEYQNLVGLLIEAIKEQNHRVDSLQSIIENCCQNNQTIGTLNSNQSTNGITAIVYQNNPNPFSQETSIGYFLPASTQSASLMILDMQGKMIKSIQVTTYGQSSVKINGGELTPGVYYYTLIADGKEIGTKKMILTQ